MTHFFSCDCCTTSFRLRRVNTASGGVLEERREASGASVLFSSCAPGDTAAREKVVANFLREQLRLMAGNDAASLDGASVIISGMAASSIGWRELPYARVPVGLDGASIVQDSFELSVDAGSRARIHLISGVRAEADMMRGEETEILGVFADDRHGRIAEDGIVVLPAVNRWLLSGLLVGSEVADLAARELDVLLLRAAAEPLSAAYRLAFETLGLGSRLTVVPPEEMSLASVRGHRALLAHCSKPDSQPVH